MFLTSKTPDIRNLKVSEQTNNFRKNVRVDPQEYIDRINHHWIRVPNIKKQPLLAIFQAQRAKLNFSWILFYFRVLHIENIIVAIFSCLSDYKKREPKN